LGEVAYREGRYNDAKSLFLQVDSASDLRGKSQVYLQKIDSLMASHAPLTTEATDPADNSFDTDPYPVNHVIDGTEAKVDLYGDIEGGPDSVKYRTFLVYYEQKNNRTKCIKIELPNGEPMVLGEFDSEPHNALWDSNQHVVYFLTDKATYIANYTTNQQVRKIPGVLSEGTTIDQATINKKNNKLCTCSYQDVELGANNELTKRFERLLTPDQKSDIKDGINSAAKVVEYRELDEVGNWQLKLETAYTGNTEADRPECDENSFPVEAREGTLLTSEQLPRNAPDGIFQLTDNGVITNYMHHFEDLQMSVPRVPGFSLFAVNADYNLMVGSKYYEEENGSSAWDHFEFSLPPYAVDKKNRQLKELAGGSDYIKIAVAGNFIMVVDGYTNSNPTIYDINTNREVGKYTGTKAFFIQEKLP
jgi:hypothetical protein